MGSQRKASPLTPQKRRGVCERKRISGLTPEIPRLVKRAEADPTKKDGVCLPESLLANVAPSSRRLPPHPSHLAFCLCLPHAWGAREKMDPPEAQERRRGPTLLPPPHDTAGGGGEVSRVQKGQMLRRKRAGPTPRPPTPPPPPAKEKLKETAFQTELLSSKSFLFFLFFSLSLSRICSMQTLKTFYSIFTEKETGPSPVYVGILCPSPHLGGKRG